MWNGDLQNGQTVLVHAVSHMTVSLYRSRDLPPLQGASSVGLAAIQLARAIRSNVVVMATSRTEEKLAQCTENGAQHVINSKEKNFKEEVMKITDGKGKNKLHFCLLSWICLWPAFILTFLFS